jgi:hypothetical protein
MLNRDKPRALLVIQLMLGIVAILTFEPCRANGGDNAEYGVARVKPDWAVDAQTTLLMDFRQPGQQAVRHSVSGWSLPPVDATILPSEGLAAAIKIPSQGHFDPARFTMELILKTRPGATDRTPIVDWSIPRQFDAQIRVDGLVLRIKGLDTSVGLNNNGHSILTNGANQWVYLAVGVDLANGRVAAVARGMDGRLLGDRVEFIKQAGVLTDVDPAAWKALASELPANSLAAWEAAAGNVQQLIQQGQGVSLTLGSEQIAIQQVRISGAFRPDILLPAAAPKQSEGMILSADAIDRARAKPTITARSLGMNRYNQRTVRVEEQQLTLTPGGEPVKMLLPDLRAGLYAVHLYGHVDSKGRDKLERIWSPCPIEFAARDAKGKVITTGRRLAKQSFLLQRLQGFELRTLEPGPITLELKLPSHAQESLRLVYVNVIDHLAELPDVAIKSSQNLGTNESQPRRLTTLAAERLRRDDDIWASMPPLNQHWQIHNAVPAFVNAPSVANLPNYELASHGVWDGKKFQPTRYLATAEHSLKPLDMVNTQTGEIFSHAKVLAGEPWPGERPDDGTGIFLTRKEFPKLPHDIYDAPRAILFGRRIQYYLGLLGVWDYNSASLPAKYAKTGDPEVGHDAAMALARLAYDWPLLEMNLHELRVSTHSPDLEFNTDWSQSRNGKYFGAGWSGFTTVELMQAYDQIFPYIQDNQAFADALRRFIPWVATPRDVVRFFDRYLVFASVRDYRKNLIRAAPVEEMAGDMLGPHPLTVPLFDLTRQHANIYPYEGTYQDLYATALSRSGSYHIGSFMVYGYGDAPNTINRAFRARQAKAKGVPLPMDLSDIGRHRKVPAAGHFMLDMWVAGGFPFMIGDASGGPHTGPQAAWKRISTTPQAHRQMFELTGSPRHAWVLKRLGSSDPAVLKAAQSQRDPILHNPSRVVPDWGAILEMNPDEVDLTRRTAATLRLGIGQGHSHNDYLDLNLFAMGLPLAVDLAARDEGINWSRPSAGWSFLHNHAIAHDTDDPRSAGSQNGEPRLTAFAPPVLRSQYRNADGSEQLDRDIVLMHIGDVRDGDGYVFDLQRLRGRKLHTWCFHGCESDDLVINTVMNDKTVRWTDRTLKPHRVGQAPAKLEAVWTMTREAREVPHDFNGGGVIKTVACEPHVLGERFNASLPPVRVRATLLKQEGAQVLQGSPFSQAYSYRFPFLWVQKPAESESIFPAVYDWYRGDQPTLLGFEQVPGQAGVYRVTTQGGQVDTFTCSEQSLTVVSRDARGPRWIKLVGSEQIEADGITVRAAQPLYRATITDIDYHAGRLTLDQPLPADTYAMVGNAGRTSSLLLRGTGVDRRFDDDLLMHQSTITSAKIIGKDSVALETELKVFRADVGNRKLSGLTQTSEDHRWHFRDGRLIRKPKDAALSPEVFTDANGDKQIQLQTYELGVGDVATLPVDVELRRQGSGWQVRTNVTVTVTIAGASRSFSPEPTWRDF